MFNSSQYHKQAAAKWVESDTNNKWSYQLTLIRPFI
jgi:hypothetical protein